MCSHADLAGASFRSIRGSWRSTASSSSTSADGSGLPRGAATPPVRTELRAVAPRAHPNSAMRGHHLHSAREMKDMVDHIDDLIISVRRRVRGRSARQLDRVAVTLPELHRPRIPTPKQAAIQLSRPRPTQSHILAVLLSRRSPRSHGAARSRTSHRPPRSIVSRDPAPEIQSDQLAARPSVIRSPARATTIARRLESRNAVRAAFSDSRTSLQDGLRPRRDHHWRLRVPSACESRSGGA